MTTCRLRLPLLPPPCLPAAPFFCCCLFLLLLPSLLLLCHAAYNPYIIGAVNVVFCLMVLPFSLGQFKLVVVLGLLTFASVTLCQYAGCCGAVGNTTYLAGRILATGGLNAAN
jgi:hypothetical protein